MENTYNIPTYYVYDVDSKVKIKSVDNSKTNNWTTGLVSGLTGVIKDIKYCLKSDASESRVSVTIKLDVKSRNILADKCNRLNYLKGWNHHSITVTNPIFAQGEDY